MGWFGLQGIPEYTGFLGSLGAAVASLALAFRYSGGTKRHNPVGFPDDASASVPKYQSAYSALVSRATAARLPKNKVTAADYALTAFIEAKGTAEAAGPAKLQSARRPVKPPDKPLSSDRHDRGG